MARKPEKDRTSIVIATVLHVVLIGGVGFWAYKTGKFEQMRQAILQYVKGEKKEDKKPEPVQQKQAPPPKLPPINQGVAPSQSSGTRRAVASDAPESHGGSSFFQDTRKQGEGPSTAGGAVRQTNAPILRKLALPAPRPAFAAASQSTIKQLLVERAKAAASTEAVGSEQISKAGASDAGGAVTKVAGATIVDGKFAVIRGLSDRYVSTTLNGAEIPSADPYRRAASLDLFPAQVIDRVIVSKTFTPDKPGAYTGGGVDVITKSFPERAFATLSLGLAYNTAATFNDHFLTYEGGSLDWAGKDDGTRALPPTVANTPIPPPVFTSGPRTSPNYQANIDQANELQSLTRDMGVTQFAPTQQAPPFDHNFALNAGDTTHFLGRPLGLFAGVSYRHEYRFSEDGISRRYIPNSGGFQEYSSYNDNIATDTVNWSGMASLSSQWLDDHEFSFSFFYNQNANSLARAQVGTSEADPSATFYRDRLQYIERNLTVFQMKGDDLFPTLADLKLDWLVALTDTTQDEPDQRFFNYLQQGDDYYTGKDSLPRPGDPTRYFRNLEEDNLNWQVNLTLPFRQWSAREGQFKFGLYSSTSQREFTERQIFYEGSAPFNGDPNQYLTPENLGYLGFTNNVNGRIRYDWQRYIGSYDSIYTADTAFQAGYAMLDFAAVDRLRIIGGARLEKTDMQVDSVSYIENAVTGSRFNSAVLDEVDLLPAVGLVYAITETMNLRINYSQTIARPSVRELAAYRSYDPILDVELDGNPRLQISHANNYDVRWEWFPRPGEILGVSWFYKSLSLPIERIFVSRDGSLISFNNRPEGTVMGLEFEARQSLDFLHPLLREFSMGGNLALIHSETMLTPEELASLAEVFPNPPQSRPLYDQSPYVLNADISYDNLSSGTSASLVFNIAGPRIAIASITTEDVYENPSPTLDFIVSQQLGQNLKVRFTARNLLNPDLKLTYGKDSDLIYSVYHRGITFGLTLLYDF